jgi:hypothetical protein
MLSLPPLSPMERLSLVSYTTVGLSLITGAWLAYSPQHRNSRDSYICVGIGLLALSLGLSALDLQLYAAVAGILALILGYSGKTATPRLQTITNSSYTRTLAISVITITSALLFHRLDTYSPKPLVWEAVVIENIVSPSDSPTELLHSFTSRLLWSEGLLSEGHRSLLYGYPVAELLPRFPSMFVDRLPAAIITVASIIALYGFMRSYSSPIIATISVGVLGLNELTLIFGRTGGSIAGTLFSLIIALWAYHRCLRVPTKRNAIVVALCLFVATLGYAPARLVVVYLTLLLFGGVALHKEASSRAKIGTLTTFIATAAICVIPQFMQGSYWLFASARLEHLPGMFMTGYWPDHMLDHWNEVASSVKPISMEEVASFSKTLVESVTLPNLATVLSPYAPEDRGALPFFGDPLFLKIFAPALFPFLVLGMFTLRNSQHRHLNYTLWIYTLGLLPFLLLTNRVDSYRASPLIIPCSIWISFGIAQALELLTDLPFRRSIVALCVAGAMYISVVPRIHDLSRSDTKPLRSKQVLEELNGLLAQPPVIGVESADFRVRTEMLLDSLARQKRDLLIAKEFLDKDDYVALARRRDGEHQAVIERLKAIIYRGTPMVLGPTTRFQGAADSFTKRGLSVKTLHLRELDVYLITSPSSSLEVTR